MNCEEGEVGILSYELDFMVKGKKEWSMVEFQNSQGYVNYICKESIVVT